jgi:HSP20 family protein
MTKAVVRKDINRHHTASRKLLKALPHKGGDAGVSSAVSLSDNSEEYIIYVAVPGMERKDFSVTIINKRLIVSAVKREAMHCFSQADEQSFPEWKEVFILPKDADTVMTAAEYRNGELAIHIPRGKDNPGGTPVQVYVY